MKKLMALVVIAVLVVTVLVGCGKTPPQTPPSVNTSATPSGSSSTELEKLPKGGNLVLTTNQGINYMFYPQFGSGNVPAWGWPAMETLGYMDEKGDWHLNLAETFEVDEEKFAVKIKLNEGIKFHNGNDLNADDLMWLLNYYIEKDRASLLGNPTDIRKIDEYTIEVQYSLFSLNYYHWLLTVWVYDKEQYEEIGEDRIQTTMNGTGPYIFTEVKPDISIAFKRNESYWKEHDYGPDTITFLYMKEASTQLATFLNGESANFATGDFSAIQQVEAAGFVAANEPEIKQEQFYAIPVTTNPEDPLYKKEVRQAIYLYGIDWDAIAYACFGDYGYHTDQIGYTSMPCYDSSIEVSGVDYAKAKDLLAKAGYPNGFTTTIWADQNYPATTAFQAELLKIGITADVKNISVTDAFISKPLTSGFSVNRFTFNTLLDRINKFYSPKGMFGSLTSWENTKYVDLVTKANSTASLDEQRAALKEYSKLIVNEEALYWPICNQKVKVYYQPWYKFQSASYLRGLSGIDPLAIYIDK